METCKYYSNKKSFQYMKIKFVRSVVASVSFFLGFRTSFDLSYQTLMKNSKFLVSTPVLEKLISNNGHILNF